jgi:DNA-directed RNA polymerase subunit RPC12/RpoP
MYKRLSKRAILKCVKHLYNWVDEANLFETFRCSGCGKEVKYYFMDIYVKCKTCGKEVKVRNFTAIPDAQDIIEKVVEWDGKDFEV